MAATMAATLAPQSNDDARSRLLATSGSSIEDIDQLGIQQEEFDPFDGNNDQPDAYVDANLQAPPENEWYHGRLDRATAEMRLQNSGKMGAYLVRESERKPGSYVLSYLGVKGINHFRITAVCGDFYVGGRQFESMSDLIGYYTNISYILKSERLQYPVAPPEPVDDRKRVMAILPYTKVPDTDELSFLEGEIFVVHNELEGGWLWVTSQRTSESGIVVKDLVKYLDANVDPHEGKEWFHGGITKEEAAELLLKDGDIGSFIIRNSDKNPGDYSLSFRGQDVIQRFRIQKLQEQYMMGGRYYNSLDEIVEHYMKEEIVDGHTLTEPVRPMRTEMLMQEAEDRPNVNMDEIRKRRSSGLYLMSGDKSVMQGHLSKKSSKHKKWKEYYFILNAQEQHLLFFENDKKTRPKGLIDLSYSSVYTVHESLFGRPNCFQIVVRAMNDVTNFFLNAETTELTQAWIQAIRSYCSRVARPANKSGLKQLKSLALTVLEAHKMPAKQLPHPYCVISLNDVKVARTQVQEGNRPIWNEEFIYDDFPDDIDSFTIDVCNGSKKAKAIPVCRTTVLLEKLPSGQSVDDWYPLISVASQSKGEMGSIRAKIQFVQELLMPLEEYKGLKELILAEDHHIIYALEEACVKDRPQLAGVILDIFRREGQEIGLLEALNRREIEHEEGQTTLFRANTLATTLMDRYMRTSAQSFIHRALREVVKKIMDAKQSCELNPAKLEKGADVSVNLEHLVGFLTEITESIFKSTNFCPPALRYLCGCLQRDVKAKWPSDEIVHARVVSGFIFLRLICPAILNPKLFNIVSDAPSPMASRTLTIVAKAIQNLANQVEFGANYKEPYMEALNPFIVLNKGRMVHFLNELAQSVKKCPAPPDNNTIDLARQLAALHQICVFHIKDLQRLSQTQPSLKKLLAVTEQLTNKKNQYMGRAQAKQAGKETYNTVS
ncbi:ras GTPase-activating protein 1-like [Anneissia japonica]|uniref:ras GTPase-activating protein 1-like n=1 Tax=Anneissia japonica TaxID=1529436 RepID=UPI001425A320|nr:ras GTPase-activating protein 1-like [Anneissia japonica]